MSKIVPINVVGNRIESYINVALIYLRKSKDEAAAYISRNVPEQLRDQVIKEVNDRHESSKDTTTQ